MLLQVRCIPSCPAVLLGVTQLDQPGIDAESDPPYRQAAKAPESSGGERNTLIGSDEGVPSLAFRHLAFSTRRVRRSHVKTVNPQLSVTSR